MIEVRFTSLPTSQIKMTALKTSLNLEENEENENVEGAEVEREVNGAAPEGGKKKKKKKPKKPGENIIPSYFG